ncbi:hypothetical protein [Bacillus sp. Marseille-Q3570]|uniref:hypothetical protein n=1 Tax=Bacillus sp. Marseille-Q3570 TaxID=2963522 RepID=UPI0021B6EE81|nr:hypothetical protein [Bacillus sp. Marseille-Q3570]
MESINITTFKEFWVQFNLPIIMGLIGAVIGHYRNHGVIQLPTISIPYRIPIQLKGWYNITKFPLHIIILIVIDFICFIIGLRIWKRDTDDEEILDETIMIDLGFLGDMLIGVAAGILAKTAIELADVQSQFALISTSLLAGFAGLSYLKSQQLNNWLLNLESTEDTLEQVRSRSAAKEEMSQSYDQTGSGKHKDIK